MTSVSEDVETLEASCTAGGNVKQDSCCGRMPGGSSNKSYFHSWVYIQEAHATAGMNQKHIMCNKSQSQALTGLAQWTEHRPAN